MGSFLSYAVTFASGLSLGAALVCLGIYVEFKSRAHPSVLKLAPMPMNGTDATTAQIPPSPATYEPVYLTDAQIARKERGKDDPVRRDHDPIEATRR